MSVLALDVGFRSMGWTAWHNDKPVACGTITTEPSDKKRKVRTADDNALRAAKMARELNNLIKGYNIRAVIGELPSGGAQSARALGQMAAATAVVAAVVELNGLPSEWATPSDVKVAMCGKKSASKDEMMDKARALYGKTIGFPAAKAAFEHIADSIGAYLALKDGNVIRILRAA